MNILKLFIKQIKAHPVTIIFFMLGYFISILIFSIGFSNMVYMQNSIVERNSGIYKDSLNVYISSSKNIEYENIVDSFKDISSKSKIRITTLSSYIGENNKEYEIIAEYFKEDTNSNFPIIKGRYFTSQEVLQMERVVVLGKELESFTYFDSNKQKVKIGGEEYTVVGLIGDKNRDSIWDKTIFIPITVVPESSKLSYFRVMSSSLLLISDEQKEANDLQSIIKNIKKVDPDSSIESKRTEESKNVFLYVVSQNVGLLLISGILFAFSVINIVNISSFWINERKIEIAIRKSFGISNLQIIILMFTEFLSITFITALISLSSQIVLGITIKDIFGYHLYVSKENFALALIISIFSAFITIVIPARKILNISPIEALKI